jgi:hypothetical protein
MNPSEALEWLLENGAEEEAEGVAMDLKGKLASGAGHLRRQEDSAPGKMSLLYNHLPNF